MDESKALETLAALAHETRLRAYRALLEAAPDALPAGRVAERLDVVQNTMSTHLAVLARTGLVSSRRDGRNVLYRAEPRAMRAFLVWMTGDCCRGRPDICAPFFAALEHVEDPA